MVYTDIRRLDGQKGRHSDISNYRKQLLLKELGRKGEDWHEHNLRASTALTPDEEDAHAVSADASGASGSWQLELVLSSATGGILMDAESPIYLFPALHSSPVFPISRTQQEDIQKGSLRNTVGSPCPRIRGRSTLPICPNFSLILTIILSFFCSVF